MKLKRTPKNVPVKKGVSRRKFLFGSAASLFLFGCSRIEIPKEKLAPQAGGGAVVEELPVFSRQYVLQAMRQTREGGWGPITVKREKGEELVSSPTGILGARVLSPDGSTHLVNGVEEGIKRNIGEFDFYIDLNMGHIIIYEPGSKEAIAGILPLASKTLERLRAGEDATKLLSFLVVPRPGFYKKGINPNIVVVASPDDVDLVYYDNKVNGYRSQPLSGGRNLTEISRGQRPYLCASIDQEGGKDYVTFLFSNIRTTYRTPVMYGFTMDPVNADIYEPTRIKVE